MTQAADTADEQLDSQAANDTVADPGADGEHAEQPDEVEVVIEGLQQEAADEPPEDRAPQWVRDLRKEAREKDRVIRALEQKLAAAQPAPAAIVVGDEPTLEGCGYNGEKFAQEYKAWLKRSQQADQQRAEAEKAAKAQNEAWSQRITCYQNEKAGLKVKDFDAAETVVLGAFDQLQQSILVAGAEKPGLLMYALGKNPGKARELAAIKDPVKLAFALARLEEKLKVTPRKPSAAAETRLPAGGRAAGEAALETSPDRTLDKLREEALKTGDLSKVIQYKNSLKARAA